MFRSHTSTAWYHSSNALGGSFFEPLGFGEVSFAISHQIHCVPDPIRSLPAYRARDRHKAGDWTFQAEAPSPRWARQSSGSLRWVWQTPLPHLTAPVTDVPKEDIEAIRDATIITTIEIDADGEFSITTSDAGNPEQANTVRFTDGEENSITNPLNGETLKVIEVI